MEKAKVYFTDFHTVAFGDGLPAKLKKLIKKAGIQDLDMEGKFVAIKMHIVGSFFASNTFRVRLTRRMAI